MKKFLILLTTLCCCASFAETYTMDWYMDGEPYAQTTCQPGDDIILPQTPYKYGYTFDGWVTYTPIEYLDEPDNRQYINTNLFLTTSNIRIIAKVALHSLPSRNSIYGWNRGVFGGWADNGDSDTSLSFIFYNEFGTQQARVVYGAGYGTSFLQSYTFDIDTAYEIDCSFVPSGFSCKVNDTVVNRASINIGTRTLLTPLTICGIGKNGANLRVWYYKIYQDDILVGDFIPVLDKDGTPCMYDKVTKQFFYNQGTGQFIAGPAI